jgi:hypothetical protein
VAARGAIGVYAVSTGEDAFLMSGGIGVFGTSEGSGWAARFDGEVTVNGGFVANIKSAAGPKCAGHRLRRDRGHHQLPRVRDPQNANCPGPFSYRIVARRKDMTPPRLAPISPEATAAVSPPERRPAPTHPNPAVHAAEPSPHLSTPMAKPTSRANLSFG